MNTINIYTINTKYGFFFFLFQDIRDAFPDLGIVSVTIERNDGRYKASAKLTLDYPEILDDWPESRQNVFVRNKEVYLYTAPCGKNSLNI